MTGRPIPVTFRAMAKTMKRGAASGDRASLRFSRVNGILLVAAVLVIAAGYYLVAQASTILAPLLLVLGYVVLIPLGIIL